LLAIVQEIGAAGGLAAVVGLAVLSALYFSHARDVKRLREWAGRAPERSAAAATGTGSATARQPVMVSPRRSQHWYSRIGTPYFAVALVGLLVLCGGAAYGVARLTGDDNSGNAQANSKPKPGAGVKPGNVTVAVLNGTTVPGLAAALRDHITAAGFKKGMINDFPDQQLAASVVEYAPGHQAEAKAVSRTVGISRRQPATADSRALAGDATVIVIAGADKGP
jgi:hypothetical protein